MRKRKKKRGLIPKEKTLAYWRRESLRSIRRQNRFLQISHTASTIEAREWAHREYKQECLNGEEVERNLEKAWRADLERSRLEWAERRERIRKLYLRYDPDKK